MARKYFGTDGIRGRANGVITPELALKVGQAAGLLFKRGDHRHRVLIGKDTRLSGYMIENALVAGFTSVGMDVLLLGPMPTPAVAMLTRSMRCDLGVMISASHNPYEDNGIKLFGPDGFKLSDDVELEIEALIDSDLTRRLAGSATLGRAKRIESVHAHRGEAAHHGVFDHVARQARVLADHHAMAIIAALEHEAGRLADPQGEVGGDDPVGASPDSVGSEVFPHVLCLRISQRQLALRSSQSNLPEFGQGFRLKSVHHK